MSSTSSLEAFGTEMESMVGGDYEEDNDTSEEDDSLEDDKDND